MNRTVASAERASSTFSGNSIPSIHRPPAKPAVLIATIDPEIRVALSSLLENASIDAIWVSSVKDVKALIGKQRFAACLCGFWLHDGTYREVIRHVRREQLGIPAIIVAAPACPSEYRDNLAALNLEALDFLGYPYQQSELERMLPDIFACDSRAIAHPNRGIEFEFPERGAA
jgi:DNA-binding NtrC family response regulator